MWVVLGLAGATALALAGVGAAAYRRGYESGAQDVQAKWDERERGIAIATTEQLIRARKAEKALTEKLEQQKQEHRREVARINADHRRALDRLRDRPDNRAGAGGVPDGATAGVGCTGEGLSRPDGEFLAGLAADAARTQAALQWCVAQYNEVREQINGRTQD